MSAYVGPRQPRLIDNAYLRWLRKQACSCGCGKPAPSDAAHIKSGSVAMGKPPAGTLRPSDFWAVPLNRSCHMRQHAYGDELGWWSAHGRDPFKLAISYYAEFQAGRITATEPRPKGPRKVKPRKPRAQRQKLKGRGFDKKHRPFPKGGWLG